MKRAIAFSACLLAAAVCHAAQPARIWILPFENQRADSSLDYLAHALPALLADAVSRSSGYAVVDRERLNLVLAEQSLTLSGLAAPETRLRVGRLLGASVMISGSFVEDGEGVRIAMRATDLETGIVTATAEGAGPIGRIGQLAGQLYGRLSGGMERRLPEVPAEQIDQAPAANLHFMKGLGHYFSAHYSEALAEFLAAAEERSLADISGLWLANTYMARAQYTHAYLELARLKDFRPGEVAAKKLVCEQQLGVEDARMIRELAARQPAGRK